MSNLVGLFSVWIQLIAYHNKDFLLKILSYFYNNSVFVISILLLFVHLGKEMGSQLSWWFFASGIPELK